MMNKLSNAEFAKKFDAVAEIYDEITNLYAVERRVGETLKYLHGSCLEVGAGSGNLARRIPDKSNYIFSDISPRMCEIASGKNGYKVVCCDAENLPFENNSFETVVSLEVIYYLNNPVKFIREAYRVLKPGGNVVICMFNDDTRIYNHFRHIMRKLKISRSFFDDGADRSLRLDYLKRSLIENRFEIMDIKKMILIPDERFHRLNLILEKTFLNWFSIFVFIAARKI